MGNKRGAVVRESDGMMQSVGVTQMLGEVGTGKEEFV